MQPVGGGSQAAPPKSDGIGVPVPRREVTNEMRTISGKLAGWAGAALLGISALSAAVAAPSETAKPGEIAGFGELAHYYRSFERDMTSLNESAFGSSDEVRQAASLLASYDPARLSRGFFAHHALLAASSRNFASGIRDAADDVGEDRLMAKAASNQSYFLQLPDSDEALSLVMSAVTENLDRMHFMANRLERRAYELQGADHVARRIAERWEAEQAERASYRGDDYSFTRTPYTAWPTLNRIMTLAARVSIDALEGEHAAASDTLLTDRESAKCLHWAKLNLDQCLAAARLPSEEAYCAGKHGLGEVSSCWASLAP